MRLTAESAAGPLFTADTDWIERFSPGIVHPDPLVTSISVLTDQEVALMTRADLLDVRIAAEAAGEPGGPRSLAHLDDSTLRRLVLLMRRCLRNRVNAVAFQCSASAGQVAASTVHER